MAINEQNILEVKNLQTNFYSDKGVTKAINNISFTLKKGETVGIVGESGSGKSVTSLSIMRLIPNPPGKIEGGEVILHSRFDGTLDLLQLPENKMRTMRGDDVAMIFQEPMTSLNPVYTCGDQVMEAIILHQKVSREEAKKITIEMFNKVNLPRPESMFDAYPHQISGGQKQRVMIAMALSCNPSVLIADEPTTALDVTVQANILNLLRKLRAEMDTSIIFISHDLGVIAEICDKVIVMYKGKIVEQGSVWEIFSNPQHPYTKGLLACRPRLDLRLKVLPTVSDFMVENADGTISEIEQNKFTSVGEAILANIVSETEYREQVYSYTKKDPILEVKNLKVHFPVTKGLLNRVVDTVKAVDDVSFKVYPGETLGLVGESGCGKTTLGRAILGLIESTSGEIIFDGRNIANYTKEEFRHLRKDIQIIFQDPYSSLNPRMTVGEAIMEPMKVHKVLENDFARKKRVIELLETVNLKAEHFNLYPHQFSGGQRQRICIARALALNPRFIICDESVSALDVSVQAQVLNLLNNLKKQFGFTYIFISHDLSVVKFMSDRMIVMNKGKIEEMGISDDIYQNPQKEYTRNLINAIPKGDLEDIRRNMLTRMLQKSSAAV